MGSLQFRQDREESELDAIGALGNTLRIDAEETTDTWTLEAGKSWYWGSFSPAVSIYLSRLETDLRGDGALVVVSQGVFETSSKEDLDGLDLGIRVSIDYLYPITHEVALVPSLGVGYNRSLSGDITGSSLTVVSSGAQSLSLPAQNTRGSLEDEDQATLEAALQLMLGSWLVSASYAYPWLTDPNDEQWLVSLSRSF